MSSRRLLWFITLHVLFYHPLRVFWFSSLRNWLELILKALIWIYCDLLNRLFIWLLYVCNLLFLIIGILEGKVIILIVKSSLWLRFRKLLRVAFLISWFYKHLSFILNVNFIASPNIFCCILLHDSVFLYINCIIWATWLFDVFTNDPTINVYCRVISTLLVHQKRDLFVYDVILEL